MNDKCVEFATLILWFVGVCFVYGFIDMLVDAVKDEIEAQRKVKEASNVRPE